MKRLLRNRFVIVALFVTALTLNAAAAAHSHDDAEDAPHWYCSVCGCNSINFDPDYHGNIPCDYIIGWFWRCTLN